MTRKKLTIYDYLRCKGKRQLSVLFVHSADEAMAAEEAGIDMICTSHDAPQYGIYNSFDELKRIREAAPSCFMQSGGAVNVASEYPKFDPATSRRNHMTDWPGDQPAGGPPARAETAGQGKAKTWPAARKRGEHKPRPNGAQKRIQNVKNKSCGWTVP